jgi:Fe-S-cluster-containing dehydrogenase component/formate-dependent nitrite reductase membrane component NrfD
MANYGFAIDLRRCIGCHACTIACKAEHDIPIGVNRCWVKTVERGTFPDTRRFFFPVLCNQCDQAPCVRICPTNALFKRRDGIVDLNGDACIGCRACMQACPYDQLFIDPNTRTAEKCNFCANRVENRLLPACVSVCPTECRVFGDLDDPASPLARLVAAEPVAVRKPEKGTRPKIFYLAADESVIRPELAARPLLFREGQVALRPVGAPAGHPGAPGDPRVDYDVPHRKPWGLDLVVYLVAKGVAAGALFFSALFWWLGFREPLTVVAGPVVSLIGLGVTTVMLVADLERPERFYYLLTRPNWRSWLVKGAYVLMGHGALAAAWLAAAWSGAHGAAALLVGPILVVSTLAAIYTSFLFAQGLGRDLWQGPYSAVDLAAQAGAAGAAALIVIGTLVGAGPGLMTALTWSLFGSVAAHLALMGIEYGLAPHPSVHYGLAAATITRGAYARLFWGVAVAGGGLVPLLLAAAGAAGGAGAGAPAAAAVLALAGGAVWDYIWIEAGQSVPLS